MFTAGVLEEDCSITRYQLLLLHQLEFQTWCGRTGVERMWDFYYSQRLSFGGFTRPIMGLVLRAVQGREVFIIICYNNTYML